VPDEPPEPPASARHRDALRDGEPAVQLRLFEWGQGDRVVRRKGGRARARGRREALHRALSGREARRSRLTLRVDWPAMDVLVLIDRLDHLLHNAKALPPAH